MRDGVQTDIYRYDLRARHLSQLTSTKESEYSPTVLPDRDGFSVVRVEADGTQRLWKFSFGTAAPTVILPDVKPVGYHAWADADTLVLFVLGDPPTLRLASVKSGRAERVADHPGRTFAPGRTGTVWAVLKTPGKAPWQIVELDTRTHQTRPVARTLAGSEDYAVLPDGRVLAGSGSKIFLLDGGAAWREIADLAARGIDDITRLAVSPSGNLLAIVCRQPRPPA
jgi:hypothetical protein